MGSSSPALGSFVLAQDVYTAGDSRILWSTFPVNACLAIVDHTTGLKNILSRLLSQFMSGSFVGKNYILCVSDSIYKYFSNSAQIQIHTLLCFQYKYTKFWYTNTYLNPTLTTLDILFYVMTTCFRYLSKPSSLDENACYHLLKVSSEITTSDK